MIYIDKQVKAITYNGTNIPLVSKQLDYQVTFKVGDSVWQVYDVKAGNSVHAPNNLPLRIMYWAMDSAGQTRATFPITPTQDTTVYAITFDSTGLPSEYQEVEYLQGINGPYIVAFSGQTDNTFGFWAKYSMLQSGDNYPAGFSTTNNARFLTYGATGDNNLWKYGWGTYSTGWCHPQLSQLSNPTGLTNPIVTQQNHLNDGKIGFNNDLWDISGYGGTFTNTNFYIFRSYYTAITARFWYAILTRGPEVIRKLVPCYRKSDSVPGMYDLINNEFLTNAGSGNFTVGPDVN